jgi:hypothetical protein
VTTLKWFGSLGAAVVDLATQLLAYGQRRWGGLTRDLVARLEASRLPPVPARFDVRELDDLPAPVRRFFRTALTDGQAIVTGVSVEHSGSLNMGETTARWKPFTSQQRVVTRRPGFVWDARVMLLPGLPVNVHDAYVAGEGILHPALLGLVTLVDLHGAGDVAQGELMRLFAEAAWYPTALLPSQGVRWVTVDDHSARATLADGSVSVTLLFRFNDAGLIDSARADARSRSVGNTIVMTPWEGRFTNYERRHGMLVPLSGEVAWLMPAARMPYWRGTITSLRYEFAP